MNVTAGEIGYQDQQHAKRVQKQGHLDHWTSHVNTTNDAKVCVSWQKNSLYLINLPTDGCRIDNSKGYNLLFPLSHFYFLYHILWCSINSLYSFIHSLWLWCSIHLVCHSGIVVFSQLQEPPTWSIQPPLWYLATSCVCQIYWLSADRVAGLSSSIPCRSSAILHGAA